MTRKLLISGITVFLCPILSIFSGCQFIEDVFKIGIWVGVIIFLAVLALIALVIESFKK